VVIYNNFK